MPTFSLTKMADLKPHDVEQILKRAWEFKKRKDSGLADKKVLHGKVVAMIFEKPSLRTRIAFEVATASLGGIPVFLTGSQILGGPDGNLRESLYDVTKNLERFTDVLVLRVFRHETVEKMASIYSKPIINALCDKHHPSQALADLMAIQWHRSSRTLASARPKWRGLKVAYVGDGANVATSLMQMCAMMGLNFAAASPAGYEIPRAEQKVGEAWAKKSKTHLEFLRDPNEAVKNADVVYADTFISMGDEAETPQRIKDFRGYQVNGSLLKHAKKDALFMHCLPAHRGQEVTDEVMDGPHSIVFDQAECRLHIAKSLLSLCY